MKKHYSAPKLFAERFALYEHISQACQISGKPLIGNTCGYEFQSDQGLIQLFGPGRACVISVEEFDVDMYFGSMTSLIGS